MGGLLVFSANDANALKGIVKSAQVVRYQLNDEGVPYEADCLVYFTDNRVLSFHCSFIHPLCQTVMISGTGGAGYTATARGETFLHSLQTGATERCRNHYSRDK